MVPREGSVNIENQEANFQQVNASPEQVNSNSGLGGILANPVPSGTATSDLVSPTHPPPNIYTPIPQQNSTEVQP